MSIRLLQAFEKCVFQQLLLVQTVNELAAERSHLKVLELT